MTDKCNVLSIITPHEKVFYYIRNQLLIRKTTQMLKKISLLLFIAGFLFACNNDDDMIAACNAVTNTSSNSVTDNSANITWNDANNTGSYIIEYGTTGFALGGGTTISSTNTTTSISGLQGNTTYDVYVQTICSENNISMFTDVYSFTTSVTPCAAVTNVSSTLITDNSAMITWEDTINTGITYELEFGASGFSIGSGTTVASNDMSLKLLAYYQIQIMIFMLELFAQQVM